MANKINRTVVRNTAYRAGEFNLRERHNERKNESYMNGDIDPARADMNIHFKQAISPTGEPETYAQAFNRLLEEGKIVMRGLKQDAKVFEELVFDVNTAYFEDNGGYEYAKSFFEEAYRLAVKEVGGDDYILSAILHADEKNKALSDELGRDIYHFHLHVVYIPIVRKEIPWSKRTKDKSLVGKVKAVIPQISHSKKWPMRVPVERDGKKAIVNSYSLLQDRFYEHMRAAGFVGFERGERGSSAEHLSVLEFKTKMENERLADAGERVAAANDELTAANEQISTANKKLAALDTRIENLQGKILTGKQIEQIPVKVSRPIFGGSGNETVSMQLSEWEDVKKTALTQAYKDEEYHTALNENKSLKKDRAKLHKEKREITEKYDELKQSAQQGFLEHGRRDAELYNLKNAVNKIPSDVWNMYTQSKTRHRNHQQEV